MNTKKEFTIRVLVDVEKLKEASELPDIYDALKMEFEWLKESGITYVETIDVQKNCFS
jgi:Zn-finger domain-containing protein